MPSSLIIPDLIGGVSQKPHDQRDSNQVTTMDNAFPSRSHGLIKRPPAALVGELKADQVGWDDAFIHHVARTPTERYVVVIANGDLKVFDTVTGTEETVSFPDGKGYLAASTRGYRAMTVGDHTFIVNRDTVVERGTTRSAGGGKDCLIFIRMTDKKVIYTLRINGNFYASVDTGEWGNDVTTERVAASLYGTLTEGSQHEHFLEQFTIELLGSSIYIKRIDGKDFTVEGSDGLADKGMKIIKGEVQSFEELPEKAKHLMYVRITGDPTSQVDDYWVRFESGVDGTDGVGVWKEVAKPGTIRGFAADTMPHELVREGTYGAEIECDDLWRQPTYATLKSNTTEYGFVTDDADVALSGTVDDAQLVDVYDAAVRTALAGIGADATQVTFGFDVAAGTMEQGAPCGVVFSYDDGGGWAELGRTYFGTGGSYLNRTKTFTGTFPSGTRFEAQLVNGLFASSVLASRQAKLTVHGADDAVPGVSVGQTPFVRCAVGGVDAYWPMGAVITVDVDGDVFSYTLTDDMTSEDVATAIAAVIDADPDWVSAYSAPTFYSPFGSVVTAPAYFVDGVFGPQPYEDTSAGFTITDSSGGLPAAITITFELDETKFMWDRDGAMTVDEHVGRILRNRSDGSEGTVLSNSARCIEVNVLAGGTDNTFAVTDRVVVLDASATYVFQNAPWDIRLVGDDETNPFPSFMDRRIGEVFFHSNRLGFTAEDFVCMSASGGLYRFWRKTVPQLLDDDPIDIRSAHKDVGFLDSAVPWEGKLLVCSSSGHQFNLVGDPTLTPATVRLEVISAYPQTALSRPYPAGASVFFARPSAGYTHLRELYVSRDGVDSESITEHAPRYIPGDIIQMCGDSDLGFLALLPNGGSQDAIYVYCYGPPSEGAKRQKALAKWTFTGGGRIIGIDCFEGYLYVVRYRNSKVFLDRIPIADPVDPEDSHSDVGTSTYTSTVTLSRVFAADRNGNPITSGRTQLATVRPILDSGYCRVVVTPDNRDPKSYLLSSRRKRVPVLSENSAVTIDLINDQDSGFAITGLEYEVLFNNRSR